MQLRRFTGDSMPTALGAVRQALGDEAIILSNRSVDGHIEIVATAMLDERALAAAEAFEPVTPPPGIVAPAAIAAPDAPTGTFAAPAGGVGAHDTVSASAPVSSASFAHAPSTPPDTATGASPPGPSDPSPANAAVMPCSPAARSTHDAELAPAFPATTESARERSGDPAEEVKGGSTTAGAMSDTVEPSDHVGMALDAGAAEEDVAPLTLGRAVPEAPSRDAPPALHAQAVVAAASDAFETLFLRSEQRHDARAERLESRLRRLEIHLWGDIEPLKATHLRQLLRLGIGAELGVRLAESVVPGSTSEAAMRRSLALLKASLPIASDTTGIEPGVTVLSGPAGGGKSTALVKLATRQVQREGNQSVVMIAADNRRIGAFESLQVYGRLLGVPVVQAHDGAELASLIEAFSHKSLVLVDHVPTERRDAMPLPAADTLGTRDGETRRLRHLMVLPATLESRAFEALVERHVELGVTAGVLTRLDRASRLGACLAPLVRHQLGIAYWSDNAGVQTPLEKASASVLVAAVMSTGAQLAPSVDEELLLDLLQPTRRDVGETLAPGAAGVPVSAVAASPAPCGAAAIAIEGSTS